MQRSMVERTTHSVSDEVRYRLLRYLEEHPDASQRELAQHLGVSVGKINYCVQALIARGLVKMRNFRGSKKKLAYAYVLTPKGLEEKINVTSRFLKRKLAEYDAISAEIERLTRELADISPAESESASVR
jgi:EPS-associated MarR family transcriptional regulator